MIVAELRNYVSGLREVLRRHKVLGALYVAAVVLLGQWRPAQIALWLITAALILGALIWRYRNGANLSTRQFRVWQRRQYAHVTAVSPELLRRKVLPSVRIGRSRRVLVEDLRGYVDALMEAPVPQ